MPAVPAGVPEVSVATVAFGPWAARREAGGRQGDREGRTRGGGGEDEPGSVDHDRHVSPWLGGAFARHQ